MITVGWQCKLNEQWARGHLLVLKGNSSLTASESTPIHLLYYNYCRLKADFLYESTFVDNLKDKNGQPDKSHAVILFLKLTPFAPT